MLHHSCDAPARAGRSRFLALVGCLGIVLGGLCPPGALADDEPAPPPDEVEPETHAQKPVIHRLYVPYSELERIFEREGEGVFVPHEEYKRLFAAAHATPLDRMKPPLSAAFQSARYVGRAEGSSLRLEGTFEIGVLEKGWHRLPIGFAGLGIESATLDGKPALIVPSSTGTDLLIEGAGAHRLEVVLAGSAPASGDSHRIVFGLPPVPLARLELSVPGADAEIDVKPRLAAQTNVGSLGSDGATHTTYVAFLGPIAQLDVSWRRRPDEGPVEAPIVHAEVGLHGIVDRGVVRLDVRVDLAVHRSVLERVRLRVPATSVVLGVEGAGVGGWTRSDDSEFVEVRFATPQRERVSLHVALEQAIGAPPLEFDMPWVGVEGVERERGQLRIDAAEGLRVEPIATPGLIQVDTKELAQELAKGAVAGSSLAWRFPARPANIRFSATPQEPRIVVATGQRVAIEPTGSELVASIQLDVERSGIFGFEWRIPDDLEVLDVKWTGAHMDDWSVRAVPGESRRLVVSFLDRLLGRASVWVRARRAHFVPDESGRPLEVAVPLLLPIGAEHARGFLAIHVDPALDRRVVLQESMTVLDEGLQPVLAAPPLVGDRARHPQVHRFEHRDGTPRLVLSLERKAPTVVAMVDVSARLEPDRTRVAVVLHYQVSFRGVDTFRFSGPLGWAKRVHLEQPGLHLLGPEEEPRPADAPATWQATRGIWTIKASSPRLGAVEVALSIDDVPETALSSGASRSGELPSFVPLELEGRPLPNVVHHVAVRRDPQLEVEATLVEGGEEIDARELPHRLAGEEVFLAFRSYVPEHRFVVAATKHDYEPVAEVVVAHMHLETVVPEEGRAITEAYLVVRNNDRQGLELRLPAGAVIRALRVGGQAESPRVGQDRTIRIPFMTGLRKDEAFEVALVYEHDIERSGSLFRTIVARAPEPIGVDSDLLTWRVYLPDGDAIASFGGNVVPREPHQSWALQRLARLGEGLVRRPQGKATPYPGLISRFDSPFATVKPARAFEFQGRAGTGHVEITRIAAAPFTVLKSLAAMVGVLLCVGLVGVARRSGFGYGPVLLGLLILVLFLLYFAGPAWAAILGSTLIGLAIGSLWLLARAWFAQRPVEIDGGVA